MRFLFDFLSPYSYLAWKRVHALAAAHGRTVEPVPVLLAALLDHHGHKGPAEIPGKRLYTFKNVLRIAHAAGIAIAPPPAHPFNPIPAMRVAALEHPDRRRIIDALFDATWGGGPGVGDTATIVAVLDAAGLDGATLVAASEADKGRLRALTEAAIAEGVFGVPTVLVDGELFWGFDSFSHLEAFLSGADPAKDVSRWRDLPSAIQRGGPHHGLTHLSIRVADLDRAVRFYAALGYSPYFRDETSVQVIRRGGMEVIALELGGKGLDHFGFRLTAPRHLDGVVSALVAAGGSLDRRGEFAPGCPYAYVRDPDGNRVEVWFE